jgi:hypothetical protein
MDAIPAGGLAPLQFETAAPAQGAAPPACTACRAPVGGVYHMANGQVICSPCRVQAEGGPGGSALGRFARAALYGTGAAAAGGAIYYAVVATTDSQFALIAILVGFMVGRAIRAGTGGRGGWPYQVLAVGLTYLAIALSFVPLVVKSAHEGGSLAGMSEGAVYAAAIVGSLMLPVAVIAESPIVTLIIAIGLFQAWKQTRGARLEITGPYYVAQPGPMSFPAASAPAGG